MSPQDLTGLTVMKPLPKGVAAILSTQGLASLSGLLIRAADIDGLSAEESLVALRLDYGYRHPQTGAVVQPYRDEDGAPILHLLVFELDAALAASCRVPTAIDLLARMTADQRASTPYVATPLLKTPTGQRWPDSPFLGTGLCCAQPLVQELFLVGHHPVPSGARLLRRG
jgi:hypothetical protein